jgi:imidazolonepropionase-like amidohydrolase
MRTIDGRSHSLSFLLGIAVALSAAPLAAQTTSATLFRDVRVFDGTRTLSPRDVLIQSGRIAKVGERLTPPAGAVTVEAKGKTLLPGLIDAHTHTWGDASRTALVFGVTTELDMFTDAQAARAARAEQSAGQATDRADLFSAGTLVTAPKGHGTEYGMTIPTITSPDSAQAFVDARIAEGSDYIKIVYDDGRAYGLTFATLSKETMRAVIAAAHKRGTLAVVHIGTLAGARDAIESGADGLVHLFVDQSPDPEFGRLVASRRAFVTPTLTVLKSVSGEAGGATLTTDARLVRFLSRTDRTTLAQRFPPRPNSPARVYAAAEATIKQLRAAGVPILAGTDAGNPGTSHGAALHRELELLVQAGLTPSEALAAATSVPANAYHLRDRGRIAIGLRADVVLVNGDPSTDITATRAIEGVWKEGVRTDREAFAKAITAADANSAREPSGATSGLVSDFESGTPTASFGAGWSVTTDAMANGKSEAMIKVVDGGANGSTKSFEIAGTISSAVAYAWGGAMFSPGQQAMTPANLSSKKEVAFWAKGDGKTYRAMIFAESKGFTPLTQTFVADSAWKEYVFPLSAFGGIDGRDIMALMFVGGPQPGPFRLQIDDVRFR